MTAAPTRPALRWFGGKWNLAPWIIDHFPEHRVYVEPFGGAASVLLRKARSYAEVYNDLDGELVNLFRVLRSDRAEALVEALRLTPFARVEFRAAYEAASCPVEQARRTVIKSFMGFGANSVVMESTGFRSNSSRSGTTPAHDFANFPDALRLIVERIRGVVIENKAASAVMADHDGPEALHYVDPPYLHGTRNLRHGYRHEMDDAEHQALIETLRQLTGRVVVSGYPSEMYDDGLAGWRRVERDALADGAEKRTEVLWLNFEAEVDLFGWAPGVECEHGYDACPMCDG